MFGVFSLLAQEQQAVEHGRLELERERPSFVGKEPDPLLVRRHALLNA